MPQIKLTFLRKFAVILNFLLQILFCGFLDLVTTHL